MRKSATGSVQNQDFNQHAEVVGSAEKKRTPAELQSSRKLPEGDPVAHVAECCKDCAHYQLTEEINERKRAEAALRRSEQELHFRNRIAESFLKNTDQEIFTEVLRVLLEVSESPHGMIAYDNQEGGFTVQALIDEELLFSSKDFPINAFMMNNSLWMQTIRNRQASFSNDPCDLPEEHRIVGRLMMLPIFQNENLVGFMFMGNKKTDYTEEDKNLLERLSAYVAPILHAKLQKDVLERKRTEAERELAESREQLRALAANQEEVREEERKVIAREIHDEFGQALTCLKMDLSYISRRMQPNQKTLLGKVNAMMRLIDNNIQLIRDVSSQLRPGILDDFGLVSAVEWQLQSFFARTGIRYKINSNLDDKEIDSKTRTALFRIFQEALTNVMRYSEATEVKIDLSQSTDKMLFMTISDNGKGISESAIHDKRSLGILGMRERISLLGGLFHIEGKDGEGTTIQVRVPG